MIEYDTNHYWICSSSISNNIILFSVEEKGVSKMLSKHNQKEAEEIELMREKEDYDKQAKIDLYLLNSRWQRGAGVGSIFSKISRG